jgi:hypothetical protein
VEREWKEAVSKSGGVFLEKDSEGLFSFESICETLGLYPDHIRKGLMVWKEAKLKIGSLQEPYRVGRRKSGKASAPDASVKLSKLAL